MKTCKQISLEWGISERTVNDLCKKGKIDGAVKAGKFWHIPDNVEKPADGRISSGKYIKKVVPRERKSLPIGISDYVRAQSEYYYVDKTLLIKEFLDKRSLVTLFTRPRRFGKTAGLNDEALEALSGEALNQINVKRYDAEMRNDGIESILKLGIAFSGKKVKIMTE